MSTRAELVKELTGRSVKIRRNILRMIKAGKAGHAGGALSAADIMTALYFHVMNVKPEDPAWEERDRFVLSAGHKCLALYSVLAERGFMEPEIMDTYGAIKSRLPGHPDMKKIPGVESNTGALGHGLSIAGGMAMGLRMDRKKARVFVVMGDGELAEGSNWEAAAAASHHKLDNILVFVDCNRLQISGETKTVMSYEPLVDRWRSFGWGVKEINGHDYDQILDSTEGFPFEVDKPSVVIAHTVKSKGYSFAEDKYQYHYWKANEEEVRQAERDLDEAERGVK